MAIRRCPYCKAIIDEGSEYCSNCGTQLLFPEDEFIEEEIPGDKIVEEEDAEEDNPRKKKSSSGRRKKKEEKQESEPVDSEEESELDTEETVEEESEFQPVEEETEEEILVEKPDREESDEEEGIEGSQQEVENIPIDEPIEEGFPQPVDEERDEYFVEKKEPAFRTEDLEKAIDPEEKEKAEIEKFLRSLKEDRDEWNGEIPPTDELPPWAEKIKEEQPDEEPVVDKEGEKEYQVFEDVEEQAPLKEEQEEPESEYLSSEESPFEEEETKESEMDILEPRGMTPEDEVPEIKIPEEELEEELTSGEQIEDDTYGETTPDVKEDMPDTGMGLPEGVDQVSLPFDEKKSEEVKEEPSPPSKLSVWLKSRAFDVLFIAALWIVTLHIASRMLSTNLFRLIANSVLPSVAFYLVLLAVYLFLFFLFLGQTLGDHLFPHEE